MNAEKTNEVYEMDMKPKLHRILEGLSAENAKKALEVMEALPGVIDLEKPLNGKHGLENIDLSALYEEWSGLMVLRVS